MVTAYSVILDEMYAASLPLSAHQEYFLLDDRKLRVFGSLTCPTCRRRKKCTEKNSGNRGVAQTHLAVKMDMVRGLEVFVT